MEEGDLFCAICGKERRLDLSETADNNQVTEITTAVNQSRQRSSQGGQSSPSVRDIEQLRVEAESYPWRTAIVVMSVLAAVILLVVILTHSSGGPSQSYKDGWNTAVDPTQSVDCNNSIAPNGDNQNDWVQGCNDGSNAANNAYNSNGTTPTTYP
jgi:negative regulator of sigma E activity